MAESPSFQFYPGDFLSDGNVMAMTLEERGAYITLLSVCWKEDSLPLDVVKLARMCGTTPDHMEAMWEAIGPCFELSTIDPARVVQPRLEEERKKQAEWRAKSAAGGRKSARVKKERKKHNALKALREKEEAHVKGGSTTVPTKRQPNGNTSSLQSSIEELPPTQSSDVRDGGEFEDAVDNLDSTYVKRVWFDIKPIVRDRWHLGSDTVQLSGGAMIGMGAEYKFLERLLVAAAWSQEIDEPDAFVQWIARNAPRVFGWDNVEPHTLAWARTGENWSRLVGEYIKGQDPVDLGVKLRPLHDGQAGAA